MPKDQINTDEIFGKNKNIEGLTTAQLELVKEMSAQMAVEIRKQVLAELPAQAMKPEDLAIALAKAIREGNKDPIREAQLKRAKERGQKEAQARDENFRKRVAACSHMFPFPYAQITRIAWAQQSDGGYRGYCPACGGLFHPAYKDERDILVPAEPSEEVYNRMRRVPTHPLEAQPVSVGQTY